MKTTMSTLQSHFSNIDFASMPRTLQDAVTVTNRLDVEYLWIDSLCIIQDDDRDMARELADMPRIYGNAYVTICAASAKSCHEGFLHDRANRFIMELEMRYACPDGSIGNIRLSQNEPEEQILDREFDDAIDARGWAFQERILSPRLLEYGTKQMRWHCASAIHYDGGNTNTNIFASMIKYSLVHRTVIDNPKADLIDVVGWWGQAVDEYSRRSLSLPADRLIACAAIAQRVATQHNLTYAAGLWKEELALQLLWSIPSSLMEKRPTVYRAPTWSWASVDGPVRFTARKKDEPVDIEILDCVTVEAHADLPHGAVIDGFLIVRGRLRRGRLYYNRCPPTVQFDVAAGARWKEGISEDESGTHERSIRAATSCSAELNQKLLKIHQTLSNFDGVLAGLAQNLPDIDQQTLLVIEQTLSEIDKPLSEIENTDSEFDQTLASLKQSIADFRGQTCLDLEQTTSNLQQGISAFEQTNSPCIIKDHVRVVLWRDVLDDWPSSDPDAFIEARFLQILSRGKAQTQGEEGIVLVRQESTEEDHVCYRRIGSFLLIDESEYLKVSSANCFKEIEPEVVMIV